MPSITQSVSGPSTQQPRSRMLSLGFGAVAIAQLFALGLLCTQQVRKAEARETHYVVQRTAVSDCLQHVPGSTIRSCGPVDLVRSQSQDSTVAEATMPVSFNYR